MIVLLYDGFKQFHVAVALIFVLAQYCHTLRRFQLIVAVAERYLPSIVGIAERAGAETCCPGLNAQIV